MPDYKRNTEKNTMVPYDLPSTPGATINIPRRLGYGSRIRVRSAAYKVHVEQGENGEDRVFQTVDPAAAERELLIQSLLDPRTYHNLTENGRPVRIDRNWIETEMDEDDALYLGAVLMNDMQDELGVVDENTEGELSPVKENMTSSPENGFPSEDEAQSKKKQPKEKLSSEPTLAGARS